MHLKQRLSAFVALGNFLNRFLSGQTPDAEEKILFEKLQNKVDDLHLRNPWFTPDAIINALKGIAFLLQKDGLEKWIEAYPILDQPKQIRKVAVIMAGNIPMVGFHDMLCVLLSGHHLVAKLSSDDDQLIPFLTKILIHYEREWEPSIHFENSIVRNADAFIATGSDNSARYFEYYFGAYPSIIRKNRTSVAVIAGNESDEDLYQLGKDIFTYFGMGCRNVSHLLVPESYNMLRLLDAFRAFAYLTEHNKYMNNYDYRKSVALLNLQAHLDGGFLLLFENEQLFSNLATLNYSIYRSDEQLQDYLKQHKDKLQCIIGKVYIPFGRAQQPAVNEYADGLDTMQFLVSLN
jgi:hypothetical protein